MKKVIIILNAIMLLSAACVNSSRNKQKELIIFHAGSLSVPFRQIAAEYEKKNPGIKILLEPSGSLVCARKVTELKMPCDIVASADYFVINELLIPEHASWNIRFATNEMVISFLNKSAHSTEINSANWPEMLARKDVIYARADPDADPGGYRTVFTLKLAEDFYGIKGLTEVLINKDKNYIRPKEVDLIALLESNAVDYIFIYKSVAIQHDLKYIELPKEINLSDPSKNDIYKSVSLDVAGNTPGSKIRVTGDYINYSITVLTNAPQKEEAVDFIEFILSPAGMEIFKENGQNTIIPFSTEQPDLIPAKLLKYLYVK